ncbi:MAG: hypothetical protein FJY67_05330 [Calditrichaeota bacterium]|nr:hypothetical protein [Calditrichota bacterium]
MNAPPTPTPLVDPVSAPSPAPLATLGVKVWLWLLILLTVGVVVWGAVVRITGSGLSIPDWPTIAGSLTPPKSDYGWSQLQETYRAEAERLGKPGFPPDITPEAFRRMFWIEYYHRALAALVGLALVIATVTALRNRTLWHRTGGRFITLFALLIAQAGLGGVVVKGGLQPLMIAAHLITAYIFFGLAINALQAVGLAGKVVPGESKSAGRKPLITVWLLMLITLLQVFTGGLTAGLGGALVANTWPFMFNFLLPPGELILDAKFGGIGANLLHNAVFAQFVHRWLAFLPLVLYVALRLTCSFLPLTKPTRWWMRLTGLLLVAQIVVGILNLLKAAPPNLTALHSTLGLLIFGFISAVAYDLRHNAGLKRIFKPLPPPPPTIQDQLKQQRAASQTQAQTVASMGSDPSYPSAPPASAAASSEAAVAPPPSRPKPPPRPPEPSGPAEWK